MSDNTETKSEEILKLEGIANILASNKAHPMDDWKQLFFDIFGDSAKGSAESSDKKIQKKLLEIDNNEVARLQSKFVKEKTPMRNILIGILGPIIILIIFPISFTTYMYLIIIGGVFAALSFFIFMSLKSLDVEVYAEEIKDELLKLLEEHKRKIKKKENFVETKNSLLAELDKDNNGIIDIIEGSDLRVLLNKHQDKIKAIDTTYLQKCVKVSSWLEAKKSNIQQIFESVKDLNHNDVDSKTHNTLIDSLKEEIHVYEQILFNALNMVSALIDDDMLTFYEIENAFDDLNMFDSKLEKDISEKLSNIGDGLENVSEKMDKFVFGLINEMSRSTNKIIESVQTLTYVTAKTNERLEGHLKNINSSIKVGNMVNSINTYQNWRQKKLSDIKSQ